MFWHLQQARHDADYDMSARFDLEQATNRMARASEALALIRELVGDKDGELFLISLLLWQGFRKKAG